MPPVQRLDNQFVSQLEEIDRWLTSLGIRRYNRFRKYKENMVWLSAHDAAEERAQIYHKLEAEGRLTEVLSTMIDSIEIVETIPALREAEAELPLELLKTAFSGPVDSFAEDHKSNRARNAMFELNMAAMAARNGLRPVLSTTNPDISFEFQECTIKMECKRVMSEAKVFDRVGEGIEQLENSVRVGSDIGIVAVSLSRIVSQGDRVIESPDPHANLAAYLDASLRRAEPYLGRMARGKPWATALLFSVSGPFYVPGVGYTRGKAGIMFPLGLDRRSYLRELAASMRV